MPTSADLTAAQPGTPSESFGTIDANVVTVDGVLDLGRPFTELHLPGGRTVTIATTLLAASSAPAHALASSSHEVIPAGTQIIPVIEEQLQVGKRTTVTGKVLLEKHTLAYDETLDVPLAVRSYDIERVVVNRPVEVAPPIRHEGPTTIYPLVEEQLVLTTQLVLKEELRVTQRDSERRDTRTVTLHRETIEVTRTPSTD